METQLRHDMRGQGHTLLRGRAKFSNDEDVNFRLYTTVNITSSAVLLDGYLRKFFGVAGQKVGLFDSRLRVGGGLRGRAGTGLHEKLYLGPVMKKEFHWSGVGGPNRSLCAKTAARIEWDTEHLKLSKSAATGNASLNYKMMRLTDRMDVKMAVGGTWTWNPRSAKPFNVMPLIHLRENNWGATFTFPAQDSRLSRPSLVFSYDL